MRFFVCGFFCMRCPNHFCRRSQSEAECGAEREAGSAGIELRPAGAVAWKRLARRAVPVSVEAVRVPPAVALGAVAAVNLEEPLRFRLRVEVRTVPVLFRRFAGAMLHAVLPPAAPRLTLHGPFVFVRWGSDLSSSAWDRVTV